MIIITSCPRSGTGFMAKLFTFAGIPCGHEQIYGFGEGHKVLYPKADSSFMAVPFLKRHKEILHIVREPLKVVSSLWAMKGLELEYVDKYMGFVFDNLPSLHDYEGLERYMHFYIEWNKKIEEHTDNRYRLEDICKDKKGFISQFIEPKAIYEEEDYNSLKSRTGQAPTQLKLKDMPKGKIKNEFIKLTKKYGY